MALLRSGIGFLVAQLLPIALQCLFLLSLSRLIGTSVPNLPRVSVVFVRDHAKNQIDRGGSISFVTAP